MILFSPLPSASNIDVDIRLCFANPLVKLRVHEIDHARACVYIYYIIFGITCETGGTDAYVFVSVLWEAEDSNIGYQMSRMKSGS